VTTKLELVGKALNVVAMVIANVTIVTSSAVAGNASLGKEKAGQVCAACHGVDGVKVVAPAYPILAGQYEDYLVRALSDYKSGARKNVIMAGMAAALTKHDIANIAAYYASLPGPITHIKR
jgi:cytochrome c553